MTDFDDIPAALKEALREARHVFVLTGAGVSAESGVPTFREAQEGLWENVDPLKLATPQGFLADPARVWQWYRWRRQLVKEARPNPGHLALAELDNKVDALTLVTQNVDGLHAQAGSRDVVEFHGNLFADRCFDCKRSGHAGDDELPRCGHCGGLLRPGVVWFGEDIPRDAADRAFDAASRCDLMLCVGTSSTVFPAAGLTDVAAAAGAVTVEINPEPTAGPMFHHVLTGPSGLILPNLVASLDQ